MRHRTAAAVVACAVLTVVAPAEAAERYPPAGTLHEVRDFLEQRRGVAGVAVVDSRGDVRGVNGGRRFVGASVPKAMMLVAYLRRVAHARRPLATWERGLLRPMIHRSSNRAATTVYARLGDTPLRRLARRAGMSSFSTCCSWARAVFSARDQARFFARLERMTPRRFRSYAIGLLESIRARQSWGIPAVARPRGFRVFHKPGWRRTALGRLVHQVATLRRDGLRFSLAVLTDGNPSYAYGKRTIRGVTRILTRHRAARRGSASAARR